MENKIIILTEIYFLFLIYLMKQKTYCLTDHIKSKPYIYIENNIPRR